MDELQELRRAVERDPDDPSAAQRLAYALARSGADTAAYAALAEHGPLLDDPLAAELGPGLAEAEGPIIELLSEGPILLAHRRTAYGGWAWLEPLAFRQQARPFLAACYRRAPPEGAIELLGEAPLLRALDLSQLTGIRSASFGEVTALAGLRELELMATKIAEARLRELAEMPGLRVLGLYNTGLTDAGLAVLAALSSLRLLNLGNNPISDSGLPALRAMTRLVELDLRHSRVAGPGLCSLPASLKALDLGDTRLDDAGLHHIAHLGGLEELRLYDTAVTLDGLSLLVRFEHLKLLDLNGTDVPEESARALLPHIADIEC